MGRARNRAAAVALAAVLAVVLAAGCTSDTGGEVPLPSDNTPQRTTIAYVFLSTGRTIIEEPRVVDADDKYADTLAQLMKGVPETEPGVAIVQPDAQVLGVMFEDGLITVDWDRAILAFEATPEEKTLAWAGFLFTFGQFEEVEQLAFTVEGQSEGEIDGMDIAEFWGNVRIEEEPWDIQRPPSYEETEESAEETPSAE